MDGIICIDKPGDHTSFDVIARVRGILKTKKVGHGGTLDPMATGVLPVFVGHATKCCDILPIARKRYLATARLGMETDTQDITGAVRKTGGPAVGRGRLEEALASFLGGYYQTPPMYSALQVGGRRLYDLARQGIEVAREPRFVEIHALALTAFDAGDQTFTLEVECSKGTYVRTLCCDIAARAGTTATLCALRRTMSAGFTLKDCVTLEQLTALAGAGQAQSALLPVARVFDPLPRAFLSEKQARMLKNGVRIDARRIRTDAREGMVALYEGEAFLAVAAIDPESKLLCGVKLFCGR